MTAQFSAPPLEVLSPYAPVATPGANPSRVRDYVALLKPRVMTLVVFSGIAGLVAAPGHLHPFLAVIAIICLAVGAGASGAFNMWVDRDIDAIMTRTRTRPIPSGRIAPDDARDFAVVLMALSVLMLGVTTNWVAGGLLAFAQAFYAWFYTMVLKRRTPQNIVIGGAAGAFPPMIGWAAVTGNITLEPFLYFLIIFLWTPPHFWALALVSNDDYKRAKIPMLPLTHGADHTRLQMLVYTLLLWGVSLIPGFTGMTGPIYLWGNVALGGLFTLSAIQVWRLKTDRAARLMFGYSILYLFLVFTLVIIDG
jgi:heme o synthase